MDEKDKKIEFKEFETIEEFAWDATGAGTSDVAFFGEDPITPTTEEEEVIADALSEDDDTPVSTDVNTETEDKEEEEAQEDTTFFSEEEDEDETETEGEIETVEKDKTKQKSTKVVSTNVSTLQSLKERGLVEYELEEGQELTEDLAEQLIEDGYDSSIDNKMEELFSELPPIVKQINKYAMEGGDIQTLLNTLSTNKTKGISSDMDLTQEDNQELVVRDSLKAEGYDDEYINTNIDFLKSSNKLESIAATKYKKWEENHKEQQDKLFKQQNEVKKAAKENRRKLKTDLSNSIKDMKEVKGFTISKKDKTDIPTYMTERSVTLEGGGVITPMQRDLHLALQDKEKAILLSKLLREDFDFSKITKKQKSKVTKKMREDLQRTQQTPESASGSSHSKRSKKSLSDFL